jgi:hypothetical protein
VGAELRAPDPAIRREELSNTVAWYKSKGSLEAVDEISDTLGGTETVVVEGWRHTLTTPRMTLPPFTGPATAMGEGDPLTAPGLPLGTPDLRAMNRAIQDPDGANPIFRLETPRRDALGRIAPSESLYWKPRSYRGAPCFGGAYDDTTARTPDLRDPERIPAVGPHPKRTVIHVRPPEGFFAAGLNGDTGEPGATPLTPDVSLIVIDTTETADQVFRPEEVFAALALDEIPPDRLILTGDLDLPAGVSVVFEDILFTGTIRIQDPSTRLRLERCALERLVVEIATDAPAVIANDCLFNSIGGGGFLQLVYCTVLGITELARLWASDCILNGALEGLEASGHECCIRFSRIPDLEALEGCSAKNSLSNTEADPNFIQLWFEDGGNCVLRPAVFGEPGAAVLDLTSDEAIRSGAEDEGEMGCYHHRFFSAQIRALRLKLTDYLPLGQEIAVRYDPYLSRRPAALSA